MLEVCELTPRGRGAVSVLALRGTAAIEAVRELAPGLDARSRAPQLVRLRAREEDLDEALVCVLSAEEVELHVHGSPALVRRLHAHFRDRAQAQGGAQAPISAVQAPTSAVQTPASAARALTSAAQALTSVGEESIEARAWRLLPSAQCEAAARILLDQAQGALRRELEELCTLSARARAASLAELLERARVARFVFEPVDVVLSGPVNAGKSTLFNVLLGEDRAIVSDEPGTTRDLLCQRALFGAYPIELCDTAGERTIAGPSADGSIEAAGQRRARSAASAARLRLWLLPVADGQHGAGAIATAVTAAPDCIVLRTCADRASARADEWDPDAVSALARPEHARERVVAIFRRAFALPAEPWVPGRAVPFTAELSHAVAELAASSSDSAIERAVRRLLERS